jgi:hypothetical protein
MNRQSAPVGKCTRRQAHRDDAPGNVRAIGTRIATRIQFALRGGPFVDRTSPQCRLHDGGWVVRHLEPTDIGAGRDDHVDAVEDVVAQHDLGASEQVVELFHCARAEEGGGHAGMRDHKRHRHVGQRQALPHQNLPPFSFPTLLSLVLR